MTGGPPVKGDISRRRLFHGEALFGKGAPPDAAFVVLSGGISLLDSTGFHVMENFTHDQVVGMAEILSNQPRRATAVANGRTEVSMIQAARLQSAMKAMPEGHRDLLAGLADLVVALQQKRGDKA
jgi:CRP-like cAMP-binding protein